MEYNVFFSFGVSDMTFFLLNMENSGAAFFFTYVVMLVVLSIS